MLRPKRSPPPNPVALSTPIRPDSGEPKPLDQKKIASILGSTTEPVEADVVQQVLRHKGTPKPERHQGPPLPHDPDGTIYSSTYHELPDPHHNATLMVVTRRDDDGSPTAYKGFVATGPSLFGCFRELKRQLEVWRAQKDSPGNETARG